MKAYTDNLNKIHDKRRGEKREREKRCKRNAKSN
jgi:hypothetical protein